MPPCSCYSLTLCLFAFQAAEQQSSEEDVSVASWSQHNTHPSALLPLMPIVLLHISGSLYANTCSAIHKIVIRPTISSVHLQSVTSQTDWRLENENNQRLEWCNDFGCFWLKNCSSQLICHFVFSGLCQGSVRRLSDGPVPRKTGFVWVLHLVQQRLPVLHCYVILVAKIQCFSLLDVLVSL